MTTKAAHRPTITLPVTGVVVAQDGNDPLYCLRDAHGLTIAEPLYAYEASQIMTALNSHDALVKALENIDRICAPGESDPERMAVMLKQIAEHASTALVQAKGE